MSNELIKALSEITQRVRSQNADQQEKLHSLKNSFTRTLNEKCNSISNINNRIIENARTQ